MPELMPIWIANLALGLIALYVAVVTAMYFAQTWLLFRPRLLECASSASVVNAAFGGQDAGWRKPKGNPYPISERGSPKRSRRWLALVGMPGTPRLPLSPCTDGSCFSKMIPTLQTEGHDVMASQHGLDSLATDVAAVKACLARVPSPAILVGHSYGGTLITHAGTDARVAALVYIAALAPDADETSQSLLGKFPTSPVFDHLDVPEGRIWLKQSGVKHFAGDLPEAEQKLVYATQAAPVADLFNQKVEGTAWNAKPSWYVLATQDQTVPPDLQHFVSKRMKAATTEVTSSHVPMLSKPDVVLDVIRKAASTVSAS